MSEVGHWDCWGWLGDRHVSRPELNCTPECAMDLLLEKARLVSGEQDWSAWKWEAKEYATHAPRTMRFRYECANFCPSD